MSNDFDSDIFIKKLKEKDSSALESLITAYTGQIYNACLGLGFNATDAEDLTQNVWLTFLDVVINFEGRSKVRTFLFGILYNKASELRKKNNKIDFAVDIEAILDSHFDTKGQWITPPKDPENFLSSSQTMSIISECLELLPFNQKMAFSLKEVEQEITEEICNVLNH